MALQPVRIMSPTSPIAVTLRSRIMVLLPSIAHTGARLLSPFDFASQTSLASQHESTGALPPHARMPRIRRRDLRHGDLQHHERHDGKRRRDGDHRDVPSVHRERAQRGYVLEGRVEIRQRRYVRAADELAADVVPAEPSRVRSSANLDPEKPYPDSASRPLLDHGPISVDQVLEK